MKQINLTPEPDRRPAKAIEPGPLERAAMFSLGFLLWVLIGSGLVWLIVAVTTSTLRLVSSI